MFSGDFGGMEKVVLSLAQSLHETFIPVVLYVIIELRAGIDRNNRLYRFLAALPNGIEKRLFTTQKRYDTLLRSKLARSFTQDKVHLAHCHCHKSVFYLSRINKRNEGLSLPIVFTLHGIFLNKRKFSSLAVLLGYVYALFNADKIILCASHLRSHLKWLPWLNHKWQTIQNAIPHQSRSISRDRARDSLAQRFQLDKNALWIANIGRLAPEKNFELFIDISQIVSKLFAKKIQYLIVGDGPLKASLAQHAKIFADGADIVFTGFTDDINTVLAAIDVFMMTSNTEGTSMSLLEAMRASLPIVVTDVQGNAAIIDTGDNGMLFPVANAVAGSKALIKILEDEALRKKLSDNSYLKWESEFSPTGWVAKHQTIYTELISHH